MRRYIYVPQKQRCCLRERFQRMLFHLFFIPKWRRKTSKKSLNVSELLEYVFCSFFKKKTWITFQKITFIFHNNCLAGRASIWSKASSASFSYCTSTFSNSKLHNFLVKYPKKKKKKVELRYIIYSSLYKIVCKCGKSIGLKIFTIYIFIQT